MAFTNILGLVNTPSNLGLPTATEIGEAVRTWEPDPSQFKLSPILPLKSIMAQSLVWSELESIMGMTQSYKPGADVKLVGHRGRTPRQATPFFFRETGQLDETDFITAMSELSYNKLACEELVMSKAQQLDLRCETRIEWVRAKAISEGSVTVDGETVTYNIPGGNKPTPETLWTADEADPITDIQNWLMLFRGVGFGVRCLYSRKVAQYLSRNEKVRDLFRQSGFAGQLGPANVGTLLEAMVGDGQPVTFEIYDGGYLDEDTGLYSPFLADNKFLMIANPPKGQVLGHFISTPSISGAMGDSYTPRPGKFVVVNNRLKEEKPTWTQTQGIYGGVALYHPKNIVAATIAA